jgi:glycosyltransferase involved in cell wall biosynthesis
MRVGVALATYNGGRFLRDQLHSLSAQTRLPDHVVISDDASTDDTVSIAEDFRSRFPGRVDILRAETGRGPLANFLRATEACEAEIIAFCDQDDIWLPSKLAVCESAMGATPSWAAVHSLDHFRETMGGTRRTVSRTFVPGIRAVFADGGRLAAFPARPPIAC